MHGSEADSQAVAQANELYWGSDLSVNQIAERLELSKGTLYGMVQPLPAGIWCPDCGTKSVFANRTAKDRGQITCPECGWEGDADPDEVISAFHEVDAEPPPGAAWDPDRNRVLVGGALLGAAAGLALVLWARRR